jgi:soluble P-type ATPase
MIELEIPGFGPLRLSHIVSDYNGALAVDGALIPGVEERLNIIAGFLEVHVVTADTFGIARRELRGVNCVLHILEGDGHDRQKENYVEKIGSESVVALGNGRNDRLMLAAARIGIAVTEKEGCAISALTAADIHVQSALDGLDLLLNPKRLKATLRV